MGHAQVPTVAGIGRELSQSFTQGRTRSRTYPWLNECKGASRVDHYTFTQDPADSLLHEVFPVCHYITTYCAFSNRRNYTMAQVMYITDPCRAMNPQAIITDAITKDNIHFWPGYAQRGKQMRSNLIGQCHLDKQSFSCKKAVIRSQADAMPGSRRSPGSWGAPSRNNASTGAPTCAAACTMRAVCAIGTT